MKLQFLKGDSILPSTFYHPPYMLNNLDNYNYSETLNYKSSSVTNIEDLPRSSSTNSYQISESDSDKESAYLLNSDENTEKCSSLNYLSGINNSIKTLQEIYQPSNRMEDKGFIFEPELHFQTDETILNLSDIINELKLRDENFDTDLSASIEQQLGIKKEGCFILEDSEVGNHEKYFEDVISPSPQINDLEKLCNERYDEIDNTLQYNSRMLNTSSLSLSDDSEEKKNLTSIESHVNDPVTNLETFVSECWDEIDDALQYNTQSPNTSLSLSDDSKEKKNLTSIESHVNDPVTEFETVVGECWDEVEDTCPYEFQILNAPYISLSDDNENMKILTPMESHNSDCINDFESIMCKDIIAEEPLDTNWETGFTENHIKTFDICEEQILENHQIFPGNLEKDIETSIFQTDINFLQKDFCEIMEKPTNISTSQLPSVPNLCDEINVEPLSLTKFNFTQKNQFTFSKTASFVFDNVETFESKFDIFDSDALDINLNIFNQTRTEKRLELIPYENDAISHSHSHSSTLKNDGNTENEIEYQKQKSDSEDEKEISERQVLSEESASFEPEKFSEAIESNQQMCLYEKLDLNPQTERDLKINIESVSDLESNKTFVCDGDFEEIFSDDDDDDNDDDDDDDGDNFFDSFDEIVFDTPLECIEKTELIYTSEPQDTNCNETKETKNDIVLFSDLPIIFKCVDEDTLEMKEVLLYPQDRLQAIFNASDEKPMPREEAIKQLIKESKVYDGKTIGIVPNIKEPQFLQTEESDLPLSGPFESFLAKGNSTNNQLESQPKSNQEDKNCAGDTALLLHALFEQKESPKTLMIDPHNSSPESIKSHSSSRAGNKEESDYCLRCIKNEAARKSSSVPQYITARKSSSVPQYITARKSSSVPQFPAAKSSPSKSSVCIRYQRRHGITSRPSSSIPIVKTIKENVERRTKFGCESIKRYSTYFFSPRGKRSQWGKPGPPSLELRNSSTAQGNAKNKKVNIDEIATSDFKTHFQLYARRGRLKSGTVISKANSNYWLKKTRVVCDDKSERIAEECFADVAGKKLVLNIFDYVKYLIAVSRKSGLALMDIINQLKGITKPEKDLSRKATDSVVKRQYGINNLQTLYPSSKAAFSRPLHIRSSRIPVSFPTVIQYKNFK